MRKFEIGQKLLFLGRLTRFPLGKAQTTNVMHNKDTINERTLDASTNFKFASLRCRGSTASSGKVCNTKLIREEPSVIGFEMEARVKDCRPMVVIERIKRLTAEVRKAARESENETAITKESALREGE